MRQLARHLREFGASEEAIEQAVAVGNTEHAILETLALHSAAGRTVTPAQIEADGGLPFDRLVELMHGFGLPAPARDEAAFTPDEASALRELWRRSDVMPFELSVQLSRMYGRLLARIAHATIQLWASVVEPRLGTHPDERTRALLGADSFEQLLPVSDTMLAAVHRRWLEREAAHAAFRATPVTSETQAAVGAVEVSLLFCDLKDFTAFAHRQGDDAAVQIIDRFAAVVSREQGPEARLMKLLGDGFMCAYPTPQHAVEAGARIIEAMRDPGNPGVHASVHHGLAIPREGDYFGSVVNLTARLLDEASRDELVGTRIVVDQCEGLRWEPAGTVRVRGVPEDVDVFKLRR